MTTEEAYKFAMDLVSSTPTSSDFDIKEFQKLFDGGKAIFVTTEEITKEDGNQAF